MSVSTLRNADFRAKDQANLGRQAFAGLIWSRQFYHYDVDRWLKGDQGRPTPAAVPPTRAERRLAPPVQLRRRLRPQQVGIAIGRSVRRNGRRPLGARDWSTAFGPVGVLPPPTGHRRTGRLPVEISAKARGCRMVYWPLKRLASQPFHSHQISLSPSRFRDVAFSDRFTSRPKLPG